MDYDTPCQMLIYEGRTERVRNLLREAAEFVKADREGKGRMDVYFSDVDGVARYVIMMYGDDAEEYPWPPSTKEYQVQDKRVGYMSNLSTDN
jgi:hypothetical protein